MNIYVPWRRKWPPTSIFLPGESHGQRAWWVSDGGLRSRGSQSQTWLKQLSIHTHTHIYWLHCWAYEILVPQFSSVTQLCLSLCNPTDCSTPSLPVHHQLLESTQTHVHYVGDAIQPSHPLSSPSPPAFNLSQHQGLFKWVDSLHQVAKVLEFQLQHQSFQWIFRTDFF